ncbi:MAG: hypothetical protein AAF541_14785 [Pseudomonadota bacterium]
MDELTISRANKSEESLLTNLLNHYVYDMSEWFKFDPDPNGFFSYDLPCLDSEIQHVYIARYKNSPAGLAIVNQDEAHLDMKEFFILRRYRGGDTAQQFFELILQQHPGHWQVRVFAQNKPAVPFWKRAITNLTHADYTESQLLIDGQPWIHYHFDYL